PASRWCCAACWWRYGGTAESRLGRDQRPPPGSEVAKRGEEREGDDAEGLAWMGWGSLEKEEGSIILAPFLKAPKACRFRDHLHPSAVSEQFPIMTLATPAVSPIVTEVDPAALIDEAAPASTK